MGWRSEHTVLVPQAETMGALAVIRSLGRAGYRVLACSSEPGALGCRSRFATRALRSPPMGGPRFLDWLARTVAREGVEAIVPSESLLLAIRDRFNTFRTLLPLVKSEEALYRGMSKHDVTRALLEAGEGVHLPPTVLLREGLAAGTLPMERALASLGSPLYLKADGLYARASVTAGGRDAGLPFALPVGLVRRVREAGELAGSCAELHATYERFLAQGHVPGRGVGAFFLLHEGEVLAELMHRRLHEVPHAGGPSSLRETWWHEGIHADALRKLSALRWSGVAMMEYRYDEATDSFWFIELNGRFWGSLHLALHAGVDFPRLTLDAHFGRGLTREAPVRATRGIRCRHTFPADAQHLFSVWGDPAVPLLRRRTGGTDAGSGSAGAASDGRPVDVTRTETETDTAAASGTTVESKLRSTAEWLALCFDPGVKSDLWFQGDRALYLEGLRQLARDGGRIARRKRDAVLNKAALKRGAFQLARGLGLFGLARKLTRRDLRILCYHGHAMGDEARFLPDLFIDPEAFDRRLAHLKSAGYPVLPLGEAVARLEAGTLPDGAVAITIDDGFYSTWRHAVPSLQRAELPATLYVTTYYSEKQRPVFRLLVQYLFWASRASCLRLDALGISGLGSDDDGSAPSSGATLPSRFELRPGPARDALMWRIIEHGELQLDEPGRGALSERLASALGVDLAEVIASRRLGLMTREEIRRASEAGIDIQLHTHRHRLPPVEEEVRRELADNREILEPLVGERLEHFCYPSGLWTQEVLPWLREEGVRTATTCDVGFNGPGTEPLGLRRVFDGAHVSDLQFEAELSGLLELYRRAKRLLKGRDEEVPYTPVFVPEREGDRAASQAPVASTAGAVFDGASDAPSGPPADARRRRRNRARGGAATAGPARPAPGAHGNRPVNDAVGFAAGGEANAAPRGRLPTTSQPDEEERSRTLEAQPPEHA